MTVIVTTKLKSDVSVVTLLMDFTRGQGLDSFDGILPKDDMINDIFMFITNSHNYLQIVFTLLIITMHAFHVYEF